MLNRAGPADAQSPLSAAQQCRLLRAAQTCRLGSAWLSAPGPPQTAPHRAPPLCHGATLRNPNGCTRSWRWE
eukprot:5556588-Heterocapsa_arctica.AAC.1